jgi:hypothetical protein
MVGNPKLQLAVLFFGLSFLMQEGHAQEASLVGGTWLHSETVDDFYHPGEKILGSWAIEFRTDGTALSQYSQAGMGGSSVVQATFQYQLTGPSTYTDYFQGCQDSIGARGCQIFFALPPGQPRQCQFAFQSSFIVDIACGGGQSWRYTRH